MNEDLFRHAYALHREGRLADAEQAYRHILANTPDHFDALYLLGILHAQRGELEQAERLIGDAVRANPDSADALAYRGRVLNALGRPQEALASFDRAVALAPDFAPAFAERGAILAELGRHGDALAGFDRALALQPDMATAWNGRGAVLVAQRRLDDALAHYRRALAARPNDPMLLNAMGSVLAMQRRFDDALAIYDRALALAPGTVGIMHNRASALLEMQRYQEAGDQYAAVLALAPDYPLARGHLIHCRTQCCDWRSYDRDRDVVLGALAAGQRAAPPFVVTHITASAEDCYRAARLAAAADFPQPKAALWRGERYGHRRIQLAYLSADFRECATASLIPGLFETHDPEQFDLFALDFGADDHSAARARMLAPFSEVIAARTLGDDEAAAELRRREIDIAIDLTGFTANARTGILACRPAPVQVNFLGYPGTLGTDFIDYIIADAMLVPETCSGFFSEAVVYMPDTYQPNDSKRALPEHRPTRAAAGLPETGFVFASFVNTYKIKPEMFALWMRLLDAVEGSVLWTAQAKSGSVENLRREAEARGIDPDRILFAPRVPEPADHIARLALADLFLDTFPSNAHTTASDALWAGLPLVTCRGTSFASRVGASVLAAHGFAELITDSLDEYEALALRLARDPAALAALKAKLAERRRISPLFDTARYTRHLEAALRTMRERAERGETPSALHVQPMA